MPWGHRGKPLPPGLLTIPLFTLPRFPGVGEALCQIVLRNPAFGQNPKPAADWLPRSFDDVGIALKGTFPEETPGVACCVRAYRSGSQRLRSGSELRPLPGSSHITQTKK